MKNLILGLCATFLFSVAVQAQNNTLTKSGMVLLVTNVKSTYKKGMTYKDWVNVLVGSTNATQLSSHEDKLLKDVYGFVSTNATPETISKSYNGQSLLELAKVRGTSQVLSTSNAKCGFWCQMLNAVIIAIIDTIKEILQENP